MHGVRPKLSPTVSRTGRWRGGRGYESETVGTLAKPRKGARGVPKVKTGCQTCKIRHKKCDELKPSCSQCLRQGWGCDFQSPTTHLLHFTPSSGPLQAFEIPHFEFFRIVCAVEFSLFFEIPLWERIILQAALNEKCMLHAALAIGVLCRSHYDPAGMASHVEPVSVYAMRQYNLAIRALNERLDASERSWELALLGSIVFIYIEGLFEHDSSVQGLLSSAFAVLESHHGSSSLIRDGSEVLVAGGGCDGFGGSLDLGYLVGALRQIAEHQSRWAVMRNLEI